ncbi:MAG: response regulator [Salinivirgaceae bacterium]|nr:response regulator [Salinivirgaceae bacterium]
MANHIITNSNSLLRLIEDIIDISKLDAGQLKINIAKVNIRKVISDIILDYQGNMKVSGKSHLELLVKEPPGDEPIEIQSDSGRITQIISHLLDNALKFTDIGSVELGYAPIKNKQLEFYVKDTGIGFTKQEGEKILERFITGKLNRQKLYRGTGLGLSICKSLVDLLGGEIWYNSKKNIGSTFYFTINTDTKISKIKAQSQASYFATSAFDFENKTILIAEDEESNYKYLEQILSHTSAKILRAENGKEAVEIVKNNHVDLILMDIKMPIMNGLEATKIIKELHRNIPIIAQTAFTLEMDEKVSLSSGCDAYIAKPIQKNKLISLLKDFIS